MSTSINGYKFTTDFHVLYEQLVGWRDIINVEATKALYTFCATKITNLWDDYTILSKEYPLGTDPVREVSRRLQDIYEDNSAHWNVDVDFNCDLILFPTPSHTYGMLFTPQLEWAKAFENLPFVEDYSYWDNSDSLVELIGKKAYKDRENVWRSILDNWNKTPKAAGLTMSIVDSVDNFNRFDFSDKAAMLAAVPTTYQRSKRLAKELLLIELTNKIPVDLGDPFRVSTEIADYMNSPEGQDRLREKQIYVGLKLDTITETILYGK